MKKFIISIVLVNLLAACASEPKKEPVADTSTPASTTAPAPAPAPATKEGEAPRVASAAPVKADVDPLNDPTSILAKRSVYYPFDVAAVQDADKPAVQAHAKYLSEHANRKVRLEGNCDERGSNSAPAWSPDGKQLAIVLTRDGSSQIYLMRPDGSGIRRITFSGAIDTEPNFSPDGQYLLFTSDRGGSAQVYRMSIDGGPEQRLTFGEGNNFSPRHSPDGKNFVFAHLNDGKFYVAVQDFQSGQMSLLTGGGWEKKPSFAPNGKIILFASEARGRGILATVSSDGRVKQHMFTQSGDAREPVWGPNF